MNQLSAFLYLREVDKPFYIYPNELSDDPFFMGKLGDLQVCIWDRESARHFLDFAQRAQDFFAHLPFAEEFDDTDRRDWETQGDHEYEQEFKSGD